MGFTKRKYIKFKKRRTRNRYVKKTKINRKPPNKVTHKNKAKYGGSQEEDDELLASLMQTYKQISGPEAEEITLEYDPAFDVADTSVLGTLKSVGSTANTTVQSGLRATAKAIGLKFILTRILNPANADRFLFKNAFFMQFIEIPRIENIYNDRYYYVSNALRSTVSKDVRVTVKNIQIVENGDGYYIYDKEYIDKKYGNVKTVEEAQKINESKENTQETEQALKKEEEKIEETTKKVLGAAGDDAAAPAELTTEQQNTKLDAADKSESVAQTALITDSYLGRVLSIEDKHKLRKDSIIWAIPSFLNDTFHRLSFSRLNDEPLVDRAYMKYIKSDNPKYRNMKDYLYFYEEFEVFYRILHIYK